MTKLTKETPLYPIGTAARMLGISVHTMRMYERNGLVLPFRRTSNQRLYSQRDIERLQCMRDAINIEKISIEGIKRVLALIPCWAIVGCSESDQSSCPAYNGHSEPCWLLTKKGEFCRGRDCRTCEVYTAYGDCQSIKERLKNLLKTQMTSTHHDATEIPI